MTDDVLVGARPRRRRSAGLWPAWVQSIRDDVPIDVTVCIANWNCRELLRGCLESLRDRPQGVWVETIVVDNASTDGAADMVAHDFPEVVLIRNAENVGFSRASNQAAEAARGRHLFFLNNDTVVPAGALRRLVAYADAHPEVGMIGPRLRDGRGRPQISYRRKPTVAALLHRTVLLRWTGLFRRASRRYRRADFNPLEQRRVEVLAGAAVFLPREVFLAAGRWDEGFAFGGEDIDLCVRVNELRAVVYLPDVEVTHFGRVSSRENVAFADAQLPAGHVRLLRKLGTDWAALLAYKALVTCDAPCACVAKWCQFGVRRMFSGRRKAARSQLAARGTWYFLTRGLGKFWKA
jgi:N-acetylglucosaminyl-diphospho-decaprenol L-rhamnosyltransferase